VSEHEFDPFIEEIAGELRRPVRFDSTFESRVMASLGPAITPMRAPRKASTPWILRPRPFYVSPLAGLAVAAGLVALITMSVLRTAPSTELADGRAGAPPVIAHADVVPVVFEPGGTTGAVYAVPFTYIDRKASSVSIVGSFNDWDATRNPLKRTSDSVWTAMIPLAPARYEYQLVVDGQWIPDPSAQRSAESDFGGTNSVLIVSPVPR
jgi:1,4-alpha-glucan branching enzyme